MGFWFLQAQKKGLLKECNKKLRLQYARKMIRYGNTNPNFWANEVAFYLDGVSFVYKTNPMSAAMAPKARVWRRKSEGLQVTSKGSKDLAGGKRLHLIVAIAYGKGVILKEPYEKLNGNRTFSLILYANILIYVSHVQDLREMASVYSSWTTIQARFQGWQ